MIPVPPGDRPAPRDDDGGGATLIRAALRGADTLVWQWDIATDTLSDADDTPGAGSTFSVSMPVAARGAPDAG